MSPASSLRPALLASLLVAPLAAPAGAQVLAQTIVRESDLSGAVGLPVRFGRLATLGDLDGDELPELALPPPGSEASAPGGEPGERSVRLRVVGTGAVLLPLLPAGRCAVERFAPEGRDRR